MSVGQLIFDHRTERDAVHVAIIPVSSMVSLQPGQHVGLIDLERMLVGPSPNPIGIVDPFLRSAVQCHNKFHLFLYPESIINLRHHWIHPAFISKDSAKKEVTEFARRMKRSYEQLMEDAHEFLDRGFRVIDNTQNYDGTTGAEWRQFWLNYCALTGETIPEEDLNDCPYCCAC